MEDAVDILMDFLECAVHTILHTRQIYPSHIFEQRMKYGTNSVCKLSTFSFLSVALLICAAVYLVITLVLLWMTLYIRCDCLIFLQCLVIVTNETLCSATATSEHCWFWTYSHHRNASIKTIIHRLVSCHTKSSKQLLNFLVFIRRECLAVQAFGCVHVH